MTKNDSEGRICFSFQGQADKTSSWWGGIAQPGTVAGAGSWEVTPSTTSWKHRKQTIEVERVSVLWEGHQSLAPPKPPKITMDRTRNLPKPMGAYPILTTTPWLNVFFLQNHFSMKLLIRPSINGRVECIPVYRESLLIISWGWEMNHIFLD